jgi:UDP-GlcNAc3NAcA epimerase
MTMIMTVLGARPQFIKAAVVSRAFAANGVDEMLVHTGQHFDANMSDVFFEELEIPRPAYHLGIGGGTHGENTGRMVEAIEKVLLRNRPDWVMVYGDTDSTLAGAVAAVKLHIPVAHVEAGLRSFNRRMPEEINRVLTDHAASLLFAPTTAAVDHLAREGISGPMVRLVGDVMYDAALFYGAKAERSSSVLARLGLGANTYVLATIHRAENTDVQGRLAAILDGLERFGHDVILPLHPRTRGCLAASGIVMPRNVRLIDPVGYLDMVMLEKHACLIATDSGGVQKEAFFHRVPCVTLRDETEWVELVESGWNTVVRPVSGMAVGDAMNRALGCQGVSIQPYGNGTASAMIAESLAEMSPSIHDRLSPDR